MIDATKARLGMTRADVKAVFGDPDMVGRGTRKFPAPAAYRYGRLEFGFGPRWEDGLAYVMDTGESGEEHDFLLGPG